MRKRIFEIMQISKKDDAPSMAFDIVLVLVIFTNIAAMFLQTFSSLSAYNDVFEVIELVTVGFFCVEYILRILTADYLYPEKSKGAAVVRFLFSFDGVVDLLTIIPAFFLSGFVAFRLLRVVRIFHLFRINSQYDSFNVIKTVLYNKRNQIFSSVFIILILMLASSIGIYSAEHEAQPGVFENAFSGIWWSVSAMLTVGYGDIYPITVVGQIMAICIAFLGVGVVAIPTGIISAGFVEQYQRDQHSDIKQTDIDKVGEILVGAGSEFVGLTVGEIKKEYDMNIYVIIRDDLTVLATDSVKLKQGDILIINSDKLVKRKKRR